jgi:hypothetical protein
MAAFWTIQQHGESRSFIPADTEVKIIVAAPNTWAVSAVGAMNVRDQDGRHAQLQAL